MTKIFSFSLFLLIGLLSCNTQNQSDLEGLKKPVENSLEKNGKQTKETFANGKNVNKDAIKNTLGVIVLSEEYKKGSFVQLYNRDGSLWYKFTHFYDDDDEDKIKYENEDFKPFAFHPEVTLLVLRVSGENKEFYEVFVNEENGLKKYVKKDDSTLKVESWEKHILETYAIDFEEKDNPILIKQMGEKKEVDYEKVDLFMADKTDGDWLQIKWETEEVSEGEESKFENGWIRWKKEGILLIDWFYLE